MADEPVAPSWESFAELKQAFDAPPPSAEPWVFWYWMKGAVSDEGITADLEAMREAGVGGAYLMPIQGPDAPTIHGKSAYEPAATQLSPRFWRRVRHAAREADRLGLRLGFHLCDGFATAGGPWITPEASMQRLVWSTASVSGGAVEIALPQPETNEGYYRDVATVALPCPAGYGVDTAGVRPQVTTSNNEANADRLADPENTARYRSAEPCWVRYEFDDPVTARSVTITPDGTNYQSQRLRVDASDDGVTWRDVAQLGAPRHGWQEEGRPVTHALPETTARWYRFAWEPAGSEPGAEDLDSAKWAAVLKVQSIVLSSEAKLHHYRGKSGAVWRQSPTATEEQTPGATPLDAVIDLTSSVDADGTLRWEAPEGDWLIMRFGHTSTGRRNATAGGGIGLECDKLSGGPVRTQFDRWFGEARRQIVDELGESAAGRVFTTLHLDSWECGAQNWTADFPEQFNQRRGHPMTRWLPTMAGVPIESAGESERFLRDVRATISDLVAERFYGTLRALADEHGLRFTGECTSPTMPGDGMRHFAYLDAPMGEFWLRSPTHDKPTDLRDAISAAHVYGKRVVQAEAFTELRIGWDETPAKLKTLGDLVLASGVNRLVPHVWTHNPWLDRKPGQTLGGVGLFFQRDQPWVRSARGWTAYLARCHAVLQSGRPVIDIAVWTGDDYPRRALTPDKLVDLLPGLVGESAIARERSRLANEGQPQREQPAGVRASAGIPDLTRWPDPLRGYQYDSINTDALLRLASVKEGRILLPGGASYALLVAPSGVQNVATRQKLQTLEAAGALIVERFTDESLTTPRDFVATNVAGDPAEGVAWAHRTGDDWDAYFVSNQQAKTRTLNLSLRATGQAVALWDPNTGERRVANRETSSEGRTALSLTLAPRQSLLVVVGPTANDRPVGEPRETVVVGGPWRVAFAPAVGRTPPERRVETLGDATEWDGLQDFVGEARYSTRFDYDMAPTPGERVWLDVGEASAAAEVRVNGVDCGVAWTAPWRVRIDHALRVGENTIEIATPSTWKNRLIAERNAEPAERAAWTSAPVRLADDAPTQFGLLGPVRVLVEKP